MPVINRSDETSERVKCGRRDCKNQLKSKLHAVSREQVVYYTEQRRRLGPFATLSFALPPSPNELSLDQVRSEIQHRILSLAIEHPSAYYRGSMGILLVYDVSDIKTFRNVSNWMKQIEANALPDVNTILIGNKCDVDDERRVSCKTALRW